MFRIFCCCIVVFLALCSPLVAQQKEELRKQYNTALSLVQKQNYTQALAILEGVLIHPVIAVKEKSSLAEIQLLSLFTFARVYNEFAAIAYQDKEKNFEIIESYFQKAIRIYQQVLETPFVQETQFKKIRTSTKHNLEYSKLGLFSVQKEKQEQQQKSYEQKDIPTLIQELKKEEQKITQEIEKLELALPNYTTQKQKNQLLKKHLAIERKFFVLQKKIQQKYTDSKTN